MKILSVTLFVIAWACIGVLFLASPTVAQSFTDNFDGNSPVTWTTDPAGVGSGTSFVIQGGNLEIANPNVLAFLIVDGFSTKNISIRTKARLEEGDSIGISVRYTPFQTPFDNLFVGIGSGGIAFGGTGAPSGEVTILDESSTSLNVTENDVNFQLDFIGDDVRYWAWSDQEAKPDDPTGIFSQGGLGSGNIALWVGSDDGPVKGLFRFVEVVVIPEPSTLLLSLLGLAAVGIIRRRNSKV